jgi:hypothetical protein
LSAAGVCFHVTADNPWDTAPIGGIGERRDGVESSTNEQALARVSLSECHICRCWGSMAMSGYPNLHGGLVVSGLGQ